MGVTTNIIIVAIVVLIFNYILWTTSKNKEKTKKGIIKNYYRLTYRKRFIRNVWGSILAVIVSIPLYIYSNLTPKELTLFYILIILFFFIGLTYNYVNWKREENRTGEK